MHAHARLGTERLSNGRTRVSDLRSSAPLMLRETLPKPPALGVCLPWANPQLGAAQVCLAAAGAGPVGGDEFAVTVSVGPGSVLVFGDISATLVLPGPRGELSTTRFDVRVAADATLIWLPEPVIAAEGCNHVLDVTVELDDTARLLLREELVLGRHGERPGDLRHTLRVRRRERTLYHQQLAVGPGAPGWDGPAVTGSHCVIGSMLVVDPAWSEGAVDVPPVVDATAAAFALEGPAVLVTALHDDSVAVRRMLGAGLTALGRAAAGTVSRQGAARL